MSTPRIQLRAIAMRVQVELLRFEQDPYTGELLGEARTYESWQRTRNAVQELINRVLQMTASTPSTAAAVTTTATPTTATPTTDELLAELLEHL